MDITKEMLVELYVNKGLGLKKMSYALGVGISVLRNRLKKFGIESHPFHLKGRGNRLGAILSNETKKRISEAHKGKMLSPEHRAKVIKTLKNGKGAKNGSWSGGETYKDGYVFIKKPEHYRANKNGYVKRAILVAEEMLQRPITREEIVHHINHVRDDDRPENLLVMHFNHHCSLTAKERPQWKALRKNLKEV